ncbi:MAG: HTH-type transcriptional regulator IscR [Alphaproteobacteria bacterium MarineAlpha9_Bin4]|nr:SUF system Fe-S cluster assembly regulator [Pelagibacterales bacterium]PPR26460.1 MAG: HTH-type transcriptional regulator IscR [Alphaproteobacteria bacterium MarineAlpha9_Bin4]|tara:strand:- start:1732 stop:2145 length:414 start_codon:yes stop_codon:yes gene_type:complete
MLKITRLADYSVLILCCFQNKKLTAKSISNITGLGLPTVNKILSLLVKAKILLPLRGTNGGYFPSSNFKDISIKDIIEAIEGPVAITKCSEENDRNCNLLDSCITKNVWTKVNNSVTKTLEDIKINDITEKNRSFID